MITKHKLEIVFNREFTLEEIESLKDYLYENIDNYEHIHNIQLLNTLDIIVLDV